MKYLLTSLVALSLSLFVVSPVLAVGNGTPQPIVNISASNTNINQGDSVTITWSSQYAASCGNGSSGFDPTWDANWSQGSVTVTPPSLPATYTVTCNNGNGGVVSNAVTINQVVNPGSCNLTVYQNSTQTFTMETDVNKYNGQTPHMFIQWIDPNHNQQQTSAMGGTGWDAGNGDDTFTSSFTFTTLGTYTVLGYVDYSTDAGRPTNAGTSPAQNDTLSSSGQTVSSHNTTANCHVTVVNPLPNLVPGTAPTITGTVGQSVSVAGNITNNGNSDAGGFTTAFISNGDLETAGVGGLSQGASTGVSATFPASVFTSPGTYTYEYCADYYGNVTESNEGDNCIAGTIYMSNPPSPDLAAGTVSSTYAIAGSPVTLSVPVANYGSADSGGFPVLFWSGDGSLYADSGYISVPQNQTSMAYLNYTFANPGTYTVGACANRNTGGGLVIGDSNTSNDCGGTTQITVYAVPTASISLSPSSVAYGGSSTLSWSCANGATSCGGSNFNTGGQLSGSVSVSATTNTTYTVWSNGPGGTTSASQTLGVGQPYPDVVASADAPVTAVLGNAFNVTGTVYNIGNAPMNGPFSVMTQVCDASGPCNNYNANADTQMGTLYNGQSQGVAITVASPPSPGSYYYRICADTDRYWNQPNNESNEGNNCSGWQSINVIAPDLTAAGIPTVYGDWGQAVNVSGTVISDGNADAGGFSNMFVTNLNSNGTAWQSIIDGSYIGGLAQGNSAPFYGTFPASAFPNPGNYVYADCVGINSSWQWSMAESNTSNNCANGTIVIRAPDLIASDVSGNSGIVGNPVTFSATASNIGNGASGAFPVLFQIMNGDVFDSGYIGGIGAGGSAGASASYTFSSPGTYQIRACANRNTAWWGITPDSNYGNDCGNWDTVTIYAIPTASISLSPSSVAYGGSSTLTWSCASGATSCAGSNFNTGGQLSGSVSVSATTNTTYTVWSNGPGGTTSASQTLSVGQPYPDVTATVGSPVAGLMNSSLSLSGTISNIGNAAMPGPFNNAIQVCDSNCATYNQMISGQMSTLANGSSQGMGLPITIANPGNYYYRVCANTDSSWNQAAGESNPNNNCSNWQTITVTAPNLTAGVATPSSATSGTPVTFSATASNTGNGASGSFPILFVIQDSAGNNSLINSGYVGGLAPSGTATGAATYTFASAGTYVVTACANYNTSWQAITQESNYGDDCGPGTTVTVAAPAYPDLYPGTAPQVSAVLGNSVTVNGTVINQGQADTGASFKNLFKVNQNSGGWVTVQGGTDGAELAPGASDAISTTFPANAFPGAGSYAYQYCVNEDINNGWGPSVTEAPGDSNDCSPIGDIEMSLPIPPPPPPPPAPKCPGTPTFSLTATPTRVPAHSTVKLNWSAANTDKTCTLTGSDGENFVLPTGQCTEGSSGTPLVTQPITGQTVFTLTCGTAGSAQTIVNVVPKFSEF